MGGKSKKVTSGYWYKMGLHFVIAKAGILRKIIAGERTAWEGDESSNTTITINAENLFGGKKREGGIQGDLDLMFGADDQTNNTYLDSKVGISLPSFRGFFGGVFKGGKVAANNPYLKPWWFKVERIDIDWKNETDETWYPQKAAIELVPPSASSEVLASIDDTWKYQVEASGSVADYSATTYDDSGWSTGQGGFGNASPGFNTPTPNTYVAPGVGRSIWLRKTITTTHRGDIILDLYHDDGPEVWWNGASVSLTSIDYFHSTATIPAYLVLASNVVALKVTDSVPAGNPTYIYAGMGVSQNAVSDAYSMNPAHMLYQCITDRAAGMSYPASMIDEASYTAAADTLYAENFGLCMALSEQQSVRDFMQQVLDHCGGVQYDDPETGKWVLKLLRDDYDPDTLTVFDEDNIINLENFQRPVYGELVNQIVVKYVDEQVYDGKDSTTPPHNDLACIQSQGNIVSQTRTYVGLPSADLANRVADRDLRAAAVPRATARITVDRTAWALRPGDVIKITWPKLGLSEVIFRVTRFASGTLTDSTITLEIEEDVFGLPASSYVDQEDSGWSEPDTDPQDITIEDAFEAPYYDVARQLGPADLALVDADAAYIETYAARVNGLQLNYQMYTRISPADYDASDVGSYAATATATLPIDPSDTVIDYENAIDIDLLDFPVRAQIGTGRLAEIVDVLSIDTDLAQITVDRAILDTTPQAHDAGVRIFFGDQEEIGQETIERATGDSVDVKLISVAGGGDSDVAAAAVLNVVPDQRFYRPYTPGNVLIDGFAFPDTLITNPTVTWAHRDRTQQTAGYNLQTEGDIGPEAGTTYNAYLYDDDTDALIDSSTGISGTSWSPTGVGTFYARLEIYSERDSVVSWQAQVRRFYLVLDGRVTESAEARITESGDTRTTE